METTDLWLLPTMNPDGFARSREGKCSGDFYTDGRQNEERQVCMLYISGSQPFGTCVPPNQINL
jgi:hypothetical protein